MTYLIRKATRNDIPCLEKLLNVYMQESFQRAWGGTAQRLEQHGFGHEFEMIVAEACDQEAVAFAAWVSSYDLHHCMKGGEVIDLYVCPSHRGQGVAMLLIARIAKGIQEHWIVRQRNVSISGAQGVFRELSVMYLDEHFDR